MLDSSGLVDGEAHVGDSAEGCAVGSVEACEVHSVEVAWEAVKGVHSGQTSMPITMARARMDLLLDLQRFKVGVLQAEAPDAMFGASLTNRSWFGM